MASLNIKSVMLDTSFLIRLMDERDALHGNALDYFRHFLENKTTIHISTVAVAEYTVGDDAENIPVDFVQIEAFDYRDAVTAGQFHRLISGERNNIPEYNRRIIANDVKILAQIRTKEIDAIITKDFSSYGKYVKPLTDAGLLQIRFLDLNTPLTTVLGQLF